MKKWVIAIGISAISAIAQGAANPSNTSVSATSPAVKSGASSSDQNDAALLAQLSARSKAIQTLQGHFVQQKNIAVLPVPLQSTGQFQFEQGKSVLWETLTPVRNAVQLTPKGIRFDDDKHAQGEQGQPAGIDVVAKIFMGVIAGELDSLNDYFSITATGDSNRWQLQLKPRSANLAAYIKQIELAGGELTEQLDIAETNGDTTHIHFTTDKVVRKANQ